MENLTFGKKITILRKALSYSQNEIANKINVSFYTYQKWELGERKPNNFTQIQVLKEIEKIIDEKINLLQEVKKNK